MQSFSFLHLALSDIFRGRVLFHSRLGPSLALRWHSLLLVLTRTTLRCRNSWPSHVCWTLFNWSFYLLFSLILSFLCFFLSFHGFACNSTLLHRLSSCLAGRSFVLSLVRLLVLGSLLVVHLLLCGLLLLGCLWAFHLFTHALLCSTSLRFSRLFGFLSSCSLTFFGFWLPLLLSFSLGCFHGCLSFLCSLWLTSFL